MIIDFKRAITKLTHLKYLQDEDYKPKIASKVFNETDLKGMNGELLAIQLKQILDGKGLYIDLDIIPTNVNYTDSITNKSRYYIDNNGL